MPSESRVFTVRPYQPADNAEVVRIWRAGFLEMADDLYTHSFRSVGTASVMAVVVAALALLLPMAAAALGLLLCAMLALPRFGRRVLVTALRAPVAAMAKSSMGPVTLPATWLRPGYTFLVAVEAVGKPGGGAAAAPQERVVGCVAVAPRHTLHKERLVGAGAPPAPHEASVWRLAVDANVRRYGVGRLLMAAAHAAAVAGGARNVSLITANRASMAFYHRLGYAGETERRACDVLFGAGQEAAAHGLQGRMKLWSLRTRLRKGNAMVCSLG